MFSYRHAFHAGNHADVLKHAVLVAAIGHLTLKDTALSYIDTHAGAGAYRLDGEHASKSGEAAGGIGALLRIEPSSLPSMLGDYLAAVRASGGEAAGRDGMPRWYPGSPVLAQHLLRPQDSMRLFELHPTDGPKLAAQMRRREGGPRVQVTRDDGFECTPPLVPPPSRRGLILCDPSYEIKTDYARVAAWLQIVLGRFATGVVVIWHPIIGRPEAHELPRRLKRVAAAAGRPWLHALLTVQRARKPRAGAAAQWVDAGPRGASLPGSGVFVINPPHTLAERLREALPVLSGALGVEGQGHHELTASATG